MPRMPNFSGGMNEYTPQDMQAALAHGPQVANETARTLTASTGPLVQSNLQMAEIQSRERLQKQQLAVQKAQMRSQNLMSAISLGMDGAFGSIGAYSGLKKASELGDINKALLESAKGATESAKGLDTSDYMSIADDVLGFVMS